jgi:hypothetical protein
MNNNKYKEYGPLYLAKGYSTIPDKFMKKLPAIKQWTDYCHRLPTIEEVNQWSDNFSESNISMTMGEAGGVICVDVDTEDSEILELIRKELFPSKYEKVGNKGFTRFYKYTTEVTRVFKHNKSVLFELLSNGKKTTLPPSIHPTGSSYRWSGPSLLDINPEELPVLPPINLARVFDMVRQRFPETEGTSNSSFVTSGRNDDLTKLCCKLISQGSSLDDAIRELVEFDKREHAPPYFTDPEEQRHLDPYTNALKMYSYQLDRLNGIHHRKNEEYETPKLASAINNEYNEAVSLGKSQENLESEEKLKTLELPVAQGVIGIMQKNILANSWIKQPDMALSASLSLVATLIGRKFIFGGLAPNLYILNIAPSGSGKDAPQQMIKRYITDIGKDHLLGSGDYVSDASLMDSLGVKPARLDIFDEAGGILKTMTKGGSDYNKKMADILCELYTSSNSKFLGRTTAEGTKGSCDRPNVSILASTTPTGFSEGVSRSALEKGLLGRFLVFFGRGDQKAERLKEFPTLDKDTVKFLRELAEFNPEVNFDVSVGGIEQLVKEIEADESANLLLDQIFDEFDELRRNSDGDDPMLPIISRLYQQTAKIAMIHSCGRMGKDAVLNEKDVQFGYDLILYYYENMKKAVAKLVHINQNERMYSELLSYIPIIGTNGIKSQSLSTKTRYLGKRKRDELLNELIETGEVVKDRVTSKDKSFIVYWRTK